MARPATARPLFARVFARAKPAAERRSERAASAMDSAFLVLILAILPIGGGVLIRDHILHDRGVSRAKRAWKEAQPGIIRHLDQHQLPEYGAVWSTHTGLICGLVNGEGSFGGLTGMTPFFVWHGKATFEPQASYITFAPAWRRCIMDPWIELVKGSMQSGWCATQLGAKRCKWVG